jgi:hypothetical protein
MSGPSLLKVQGVETYYGNIRALAGDRPIAHCAIAGRAPHFSAHDRS